MARWAARCGWGGLGLVLLAWTVFEAVKHTGLTIPLAAAGLLVPFVASVTRPTARSGPGGVLRRVVLAPWVPPAVMAVCTAVPGPPEDTAAPFTFGLAWSTHLALRRARGAVVGQEAVSAGG
ncbi:hypothetical protein BU198_24320 [Streptomyces sp. CBMA156]|nr:hypothetical protein [Streptomyces sp. CBMA156]